jgi:hypothetical protein
MAFRRSAEHVLHLRRAEHGVRTEAVGTARAGQHHEDEHDQPTRIGNEVKQNEQAAPVLIVEAADLYGDGRNDRAQDEQAEQQQRYDAGIVRPIAEQKRKCDQRRDDDEVEQLEHPIFQATRTARKVGVAFQWQQHPVHESPPYSNRSSGSARNVPRVLEPASLFRRAVADGRS